MADALQRPVTHAGGSATLRRREPLLVVTEGACDIEFLKRISRVLRIGGEAAIDLGELEDGGQIVFIPIGGGEIAAWSERLDRLPLRRFQLHDGESGAESERRRQAIERINWRSSQCAFLTAKRSLENYLHPAAILEAGGPLIMIDDGSDVAADVARAELRRNLGRDVWPSLSRRARKRLANRAKRWLNGEAVEAMTPSRLAEQDRQGEVVQWLSAIDAMLSTPCAAYGDHVH